MADEDREGPEKAQNVRITMAPNPLPTKELYFDGIGGILYRPGMIKLNCYRVLRVDRANNTEVRTVTHRLVLPTPAIRELASVLKGVAAGGRDAESGEDGATPAAAGAG